MLSAMGLRLCAACDRHVRDLDAMCPYCGATRARPVPASPRRERRGALLFGLGTLAVTALEASCSAIPVYGAPGDAGGRDPIDSSAGPLPPRDARPEAAPYVCYDEAAATLVTGPAPALGAGQCTRAQIDESIPACLQGRSTEATCSAYRSANERCADCVFGLGSGADAGPAPLGALVLAKDGFILNIASCAAHAIGRPDCALRATREFVCVTSACPRCESDPTCTSAARAGVCSGTIDAPCSAELRAREPEWKPVCWGAGFEDAYPKVAWVLCGSPSLDGGLSDAASDADASRD